MKFLFHTLLTYVSNKTTAFNEIPLKIQYLGYAIISKTDFNYSQEIFTYLVKNVKNIKEKKPRDFLLFPRAFEFLLTSENSKRKCTSTCTRCSFSNKHSVC
ncbi:hypothetical protein Hanom_Chr09g00765731 [Helianthus anomalus]